MRRSRALAWLVLAVVATLACPAQAGRVLDGVKARGLLRCGVSEGIPGFSERRADGRWQGMEVDFCRAVAAAVLGDPEQVRFVPLKASTRFPALKSGQIDLLLRNTTWTLAREVLLDVEFPAVLVYDGQGFLVPGSGNIRSAADLAGATVCVEKGTTHVQRLTDYAAARGLAVKPLVIDSSREVVDAFVAGRCQAYTSDASQLAAVRSGMPGGAGAYTILPERISREPLGPVVDVGDREWTRVVRWVALALIGAEEQGMTRANAATVAASSSAATWKLASGRDDRVARALGVDPQWVVRAIQAVGNYGEMFERNLGSGSPLGVDRGLNRLWTQGGLLYTPPID